MRWILALFSFTGARFLSVEPAAPVYPVTLTAQATTQKSDESSRKSEDGKTATAEPRGDSKALAAARETEEHLQSVKDSLRTVKKHVTIIHATAANITHVANKLAGKEPQDTKNGLATTILIAVLAMVLVVALLTYGSVRRRDAV
eukprot:GEMP01067904.1.p2 GENE.GEMP01067904.1~~GEMP01067904.1.p2  ORF type:complete len:145 (+),score=25.28 GEMP01067904.1:220-654(+)